MLMFLAWAKLGVTTCFVLMASSLDFESVRHCIGAAWCLGQPNASWLLMESEAIPWLWIDVLSAGAWRDGWVRFPLSVDFSSVSRHTFPRGIQNLISSQCPHFLCAHWKWFCFNACSSPAHDGRETCSICCRATGGYSRADVWIPPSSSPWATLHTSECPNECNERWTHSK